MGSWRPSAMVGTQGKLTLVKGWARGTGMNLKEFAEMPAPEVYKCMSLFHESMLVQCKQFCLPSLARTANRRQHQLSTGPVQGKCCEVRLERDPTQTTPLKLQSFKTVSSAKELPSPFRPTKFSSYKVNRAVSEGKWPLTMDNESLDFSQVDGSKLCFLCS